MNITDKAVLVKLGIGMPGNTRKDRSITDEVRQAHALGDKAGRWLKQLYPQEAFEPLVAISSEARTYHYKNSLPWSDDGIRILPTAHHFAYTQAMRVFRRNYEDMAEAHFVGKLVQWETEARVMHNGTFRQEDYHSADALRRKFSFSVEMTPIPSGNDFRVSLSDSDLEIMRQDVDTRVASAVQTATRDLWSRLMDPVSAMIERLKNPDATFRNTLVGNIREIVDLVPRLNISGDSRIESFAVQAGQTLASLDPETLRDNKAVRATAVTQAQALLEKMQSYLG